MSCVTYAHLEIDVFPMRPSYLVLSIFYMSIISGCGPSERALNIAELSGDPEVGKTHYNDLCARCHGEDGRGGRGLNLIKHRKHHDDAELIDTVLEGGGGMPSFGYLEDQLIADIISHIREL